MAEERKASRTRIILMLVLGGFALAFGGCALFLANLNFAAGGGSSSKDTLSAIGAVIFIGGVLGFVTGVLWALARWADRRFSKAAKPPDSASPTEGVDGR